MNTKTHDECLVLDAELKSNSYLITQNSELGKTAWLKEIQR